MVVANPNPWNGKLHQKAFGVIFADSQSLKITQKISQHWRDAKLNVFEFLRLYFVLICQSSVIQQLTIFFYQNSPYFCKLNREIFHRFFCFTRNFVKWVKCDFWVIFKHCELQKVHHPPNDLD